MYTADDYEAAIAFLIGRLDRVHDFYIRRLAKRLLAIRDDEDAADLALLMADVYQDIADVQRLLADTIGICSRDVADIMENVLKDALHDKSFKAALEASGRAPEEIRPAVEEIADEAARTSAATLRNLSGTTVVSRIYRDAVDRAIRAVRGRREGYREAISRIIEDAGSMGLRVQYASGASRRLDSAARMNLITSINKASVAINLRIGEELGYDAIELSAHADSAPDHEPVQGRVFMRDEFFKMQAGQDCMDIDGRVFAGFPRPIGEWNCRHLPFAFSTRFSKRTWTDAQLDDLAAQNAAGCMIGGRQYSGYEAMCRMRRLETDIRRMKDRGKACEIAGDPDGQRACQKRINALEVAYSRTCSAAGRKPSWRRAEVSGYHRVKV